MTDSIACPMCKEYKYLEDFKSTAHPKAMRTAHDLALKKSSTASGEFEAVDVYLLYFRRIYEHELKRTMKILYRREELACLLRNLDKEVCGYHLESQGWYEDEEFGKKKDYLKEDEKTYAQSKWPNPLGR